MYTSLFKELAQILLCLYTVTLNFINMVNIYADSVSNKISRLRDGQDRRKVETSGMG
ncbi:MAG: hypothetical protein GQF41_1979 [Candidatus Rifleibacterium amylolyticum]|nr:MAG: hypothetical protein GQF41_1979 [Candidatus Rifleibacterium amylolyticum]